MTVELDRKDIQFSKQDYELDETERVEAYYTDPKTKRRQQVWIEWKSYDPQSFNGNPDAMILERLKALTTLLKEINTAIRPVLPIAWDILETMIPSPTTTPAASASSSKHHKELPPTSAQSPFSLSPKQNPCPASHPA